MALKKTVYSLGFEGSPLHAQLLYLGSYDNELAAIQALRSQLEWPPADPENLEALRSDLFQVSGEVAAFAIFNTAEAKAAATAPYAGSPRVFQTNIDA